jgi:hypothetical protein
MKNGGNAAAVSEKTAKIVASDTDGGVSAAGKL